MQILFKTTQSSAFDRAYPFSSGAPGFQNEFCTQYALLNFMSDDEYGWFPRNRTIMQNVKR